MHLVKTIYRNELGKNLYIYYGKLNKYIIFERPYSEFTEEDLDKLNDFIESYSILTWDSKRANTKLTKIPNKLLINNVEYRLHDCDWVKHIMTRVREDERKTEFKDI